MGNSQRESWSAPSLKSRLGRGLSVAVCSCYSVSPDLSGSRAQADLGGGHTRPCQRPLPAQRQGSKPSAELPSVRGLAGTTEHSVCPSYPEQRRDAAVCAGIAVTASPHAESCLALAAGGSGSEVAGRRRAPSSAAANFRQLTGQYFRKV